MKRRPHSDYSNYRFIGSVIMMMSVFIALSLLFYNANDRSFNVANDDAIKNIMGAPGAFISDLIMQMIGFASIQIVIISFLLGAILFVNGKLQYLWLRVPSGLISACLLSMIVHKAMSSQLFQYQMLPGGYFGYFLNDYLHIINGYKQYITIPITIFAIVSTTYFSIGINAKNWKKITNYIERNFKQIKKKILSPINIFTSLFTPNSNKKIKKYKTIDPNKHNPNQYEDDVVIGGQSVNAEFAAKLKDNFFIRLF